MNVIGTLVLAFVGLCGVAVVAAVMRAAPRGTFVAWAVVVFFVPVWVGASVGIFWAAITVVTVLAIATANGSPQLSLADALMATFVLVAVAQYAVGLSTLPATAIAVTEWVVPYIWGRLVLARVTLEFVTHTLAIVTVVAASLAIVEFATGVNLFIQIPIHGPSFEVWGTQQFRGGFARAEGAFGHSIALGGALAMGAAFILATRWGTARKLAALAIAFLGVIATLSRIGIVSFVIVVVLSIVLIPGIRRSVRVWVSLAGVVAALAVVPFLGAVFLDAGEEASGSADYRTALFDLLPQLRLVGAAPSLEGVTSGGLYLGQFANSIDNALLVVALRFGWVGAALLTAVLVVAIAPLLRRGSATPAVIACASQLPSIVSVAFITQYGMLLWFMVGLAVACRRDTGVEASSEQSIADARWAPANQARVTA